MKFLPPDTASAVDRDADCCLFCGHCGMEPAFTLAVFHGRYETPYHRCLQCRSLQISRVEWLREAYSDTSKDTDVGATQRSILTALMVRALVQGGMLRGAP